MNPEAQTHVWSHELQTRVLYANLAFKASGHRVYHALQR